MFKAHEASGPGNCSDSDTATPGTTLFHAILIEIQKGKSKLFSANSKIKSVADSRLLVLECLTFSSIEKNILTTRDNLFTLNFAQIPVSRANGLKVATPLFNVADEDAQAVSQMC